MNQLTVQTKFPIGIAWSWVKSSFAIFREKPINFIYFSLVFVFLSALPFMGAFFATLALVRILLSANYVENNEQFGLGINIGMILRQRNIFSFAIFNVGFDLILMSIVSEILNSWGISKMGVEAMASDSRVIYLLLGMSIFRSIFFGIAPAIITFNPDVGIIAALKLSWKFIITNVSVLIFAIFLLLPFLIVPLYIFTLLALSVSNLIAFSIFFLIVIILGLLFINIITIFSFKLYKDGIKRD